MNARDWVDFAFEGFVEGAKVGDPANAHVLLWDDEGTTYPRGATAWRKDADTNKAVKFLFELRAGDGIGAATVRFDWRINVKMN